MNEKYKEIENLINSNILEKTIQDNLSYIIKSYNNHSLDKFTSLSLVNIYRAGLKKVRAHKEIYKKELQQELTNFNRVVDRQITKAYYREKVLNTK
jgi:hypothetical protein